MATRLQIAVSVNNLDGFFVPAIREMETLVCKKQNYLKVCCKLASRGAVVESVELQNNNYIIRFTVQS